MLHRVVKTADQPCLGVSSIYEFGASRPDLTEINTLLARSLCAVIAGRIRDAQREGDVAAGLEPDAIAEFLVANIAGIRIAGRGGSDRTTLNSLADMALRALR
jgi:TetR/AcrR family transcriptional repressor of nem operon